MTPVCDPDVVSRVVPISKVEQLAPEVFELANARLRGEITAQEWEDAVTALLG